MGQVARVWQPSRLKGIQVSADYGIPFLTATQVFDLRFSPRKWLAIERTPNASDRFAQPGTILVTCSGNVGRATIAYKPHQNVLISHDILRVETLNDHWWGWLYAYLRSPQARAMMKASQYGHIIKHLETTHLNALPIPIPQNSLLEHFERQIHNILDMRTRAYGLILEAEAHFEGCLGSLPEIHNGESGFSVPASRSLFNGRRRFDALPHDPLVKAIREHLSINGKGFTTLSEAGYTVWLPTRFRRIPAEEGVALLDSSDLFEINPDISKRIADGHFGDQFRGRVERGWLLLSRSGQVYGLIGTLTLATAAHEEHVISDHVIRIAASKSAIIRPAYALIALSHPSLGRPLMKALAYGSSIPEIEVTDVARTQVVRLNTMDEDAIADSAEEASALYAEADLLENAISAEASEIIDRFISGQNGQAIMTAFPA
jgi:hypothetical protein